MKRSWPNLLKYYAGIYLEGLRETTKTSMRIAGLRGRESNPRRTEYEVGVLTTRPRRSIWGRVELLACVLYNSTQAKGDVPQNGSRVYVHPVQQKSSGPNILSPIPEVT
jgi:hypothetical protein